jgi:hypothetical protein
MPGPFYFAWVNADTPFDPATHNVEDEKIVEFNIEHNEGDFASLELTIKNPRIGLLAASRKVWGWLSWDNGTAIVPLFYGRLIGVPENLHNEKITLQLQARPRTFLSDKVALAETLKVAPYYDPIFIDADNREDPDTVLEARSQLWHTDRITHDVTISDILVGEDGNEDFLENEVPYDSVSIKLAQAPLRSIIVDGRVGWDQIAQGGVTINTGNTYDSYTGGGLWAGWPQAGASVGGGWEVEFGQAVDVYGIGQMPDDKFAPLTYMPEIPSGWIFIKTVDYAFLLLQSVQGVLVPLWRIKTDLRLKYDATRKRTEHVRFELKSNIQSIVSVTDEDEPETVEISSVDLHEPIDGVPPIGELSRASYFTTPRGLQSLEYLICLARAHLLLRARCVEISWDCRFERAINLSCRKNARLFDRRLPGGSALGKIVTYSLTGDGNSGAIRGKVTVSCAVGYGGAFVAVPGEPTYVQEGYVTVGYQTYTNAINVLPAGDVGYSVPIDGPNDDGLNLSGTLQAGDVVTSYEVQNPASAQYGAILGASGGDDTDAMKTKVENVLKTIPTKVHMTLRPVEGGPFETAYDITTTVLEVPVGINLEADTIDAIMNVRDGQDVAAMTGTV